MLPWAARSAVVAARAPMVWEAWCSEDPACADELVQPGPLELLGVELHQPLGDPVAHDRQRLVVGIAQSLEGQDHAALIQVEGVGDRVGRRHRLYRQHGRRGCLPLVIRSSYRLVSSTGRLTLGWTTWVPTARLRTR